jgi:hypothetical protein
VVALTDHNTCGNCPAFFEACRRVGVIPIAGMELTTIEEIHMVCLFPDLDNAMKFDGFIKEHRMPIKNRPDIFGEQLIMNENDDVIGIEENLLIMATDIDITTAARIVREDYAGVAFPAHIDKQSNGIIGVLGDFPLEPGFTAAEFHDAKKQEIYLENKLFTKVLTVFRLRGIIILFVVRIKFGVKSQRTNKKNGGEYCENAEKYNPENFTGFCRRSDGAVGDLCNLLDDELASFTCYHRSHCAYRMGSGKRIDCGGGVRIDWIILDGIFVRRHFRRCKDVFCGGDCRMYQSCFCGGGWQDSQYRVQRGNHLYGVAVFRNACVTFCKANVGDVKTHRQTA